MPLRLTLPMVAALALALAACGVKGPLQPPETQATTTQNGGKPGTTSQATPAPTGPVRPTATNMPSSPAAESKEVTQEGEEAWGANPAAAYTYVPPNTPGDSVSRPTQKGKGTPATPNKPFFLESLL